MAVLNANDVPLPYKLVRNWFDKDYYYICDNYDKPLTVPVDLNTDTTLAICTEHEAYVDVVEKIYSTIVMGMNIDPKRILLISENADLKSEIERVANKYQSTVISYEYTLTSEQTIKLQTLPEVLVALNRKPFTNRTNKCFLNFNRRWRIHRPLFVAMLKLKNLLDKGHISLGKDDCSHTWENIYELLLYVSENDKELHTQLITHKENIVNIPELYLDTTDLVSQRALLRYQDIGIVTTDNLYSETFFSVVSETYFFEDIGRFLSEKTFKPIVYRHPFVLIARPKSLSLLRDLGYKTFSPFIDESYDDETDNIKRMNMIVDEVDRLCCMSSTAIEQFLDNVSDITAHNLQTLLSKNLISESKHVHKKM